MISAGDKIDTSFELEIMQDGKADKVRFSELLDRPVVVSLYMKNNTGSCDKHNRSLAEKSAEIAAKGYRLIAISKDSCGSHKKYAEKLGIDYILASDPEHRFARAVDALVEKKMYGKVFVGPSRSAFVVDTQGTVTAVLEKVDTANHAGELLELLP